MPTGSPSFRLSLVEDSKVNLPGRSVSSTYCPSQNCFLSFLEDGSLAAVDVSTGSLLQRTQPVADAASSQSSWMCNFMTSVDRLVVSDGRRVGARKDLNGVFLLDSILQGVGNDDVIVEFPISEVPTLLAMIRKPPLHSQGAKPYRPRVLGQLEQAQGCRGLQGWQRAAKWETAILKLSSQDLSDMVSDAFNNVPRAGTDALSLPLLSLLRDRLHRLVGQPLDTSAGDGSTFRGISVAMASELQRLKTFRAWPQMTHKWALPAPMARAGFYYHPQADGDDRVLCFSCGVCLAYWEPTDEPWSEHERHGGQQCRFIKGSGNRNVPLASSLATAVAAPVHSQLPSPVGGSPVSYHSAEALLLMATDSWVSICDLHFDHQTLGTYTCEPIVQLLVHVMRDGFDLQFDSGDEEMRNSLLKRPPGGVAEPSVMVERSSSSSSSGSGGLEAVDGVDTHAAGPEMLSLLDLILATTNCSRAVVLGLCDMSSCIRQGLEKSGGNGSLVSGQDIAVDFQKCVLFSAMRGSGQGQPAQPIPMLFDTSLHSSPMWTVPQWPHLCSITSVYVMAAINVRAAGAGSPLVQNVVLVEILPSLASRTGTASAGGASTAVAGAGSSDTGASMGSPGTPYDVLTSGKAINPADMPWMLDHLDDLHLSVDKNGLLEYDVFGGNPAPVFGQPTSIATQTAEPAASASLPAESASSSSCARIVGFGSALPEECDGQFAIQSLYPVDNDQAVMVACRQPLGTEPTAVAATGESSPCSCSVSESEQCPSDQKSTCIVLFTASRDRGSGEIQKSGVLFLGSSTCTVTSSCLVPKAFSKRSDGRSLAAGSRCLLACTLSCGRLVLVDIPSLAVVTERMVYSIASPPQHSLATAPTASSSDATSSEPEDAVRDSETLDGPSALPEATERAAETADVVSQDDPTESDGGEGDGPGVVAAKQCASSDTVTPVDRACPASLQAHPTVFYCNGLEQICIVDGRCATFLEVEASVPSLSESQTSGDIEIPSSGTGELNDDSVGDFLLASVFEPCTDGHRGVRISPPACWEEVSREQLLRRQPQHLQQMASSVYATTQCPAADAPTSLPTAASFLSPGTASPLTDATHSSGLQWQTFRLLRDKPDSDSPEQTFEIIVPRHCPLARVDIKYRLKEGGVLATPVLATLLHGPGAKSARVSGAHPSSQSWPTPPFSLGSTHEFIAASGSSFACGPVPLQSGLDGLGPFGHVSLSPPSQVATTSQRSTSFYLHLAGLPASASGSGGNGAESSSSSSALSALPLEEIMISVFQWPDESTAVVALPLSSLRLKLVDDKHLWHSLINRVLGGQFDRAKYQTASAGATAFAHQQSQAMELLLWVAGMWCTHPKSPLVAVVGERCEELIMACFVRGTRSLAHQCALLFLFCTGCFTAQGADRSASGPPPFQEHLCNVMLRLTPLVVRGAVLGAAWDVLDETDDGGHGNGGGAVPPLDVGCTAGAAQWFFTGLGSLCSDVPPASVVAVLMPLLSACVGALAEGRRSLDGSEAEVRRAHDLLSRRFGLQGLPLEPCMFDAYAATGPSLVAAKTPGSASGSASAGGGGGVGGGGAAGAGGGTAAGASSHAAAASNLFGYMPHHFHGPPPTVAPSHSTYLHSAFMSNTLAPPAPLEVKLPPGHSGLPTDPASAYAFAAGLLGPPHNTTAGGHSASAASTCCSTPSSKDHSDDSPHLNPRSERFLRAVLFGTAGGEESPCLRQNTFPAQHGLLEVFPLPFFIHRHSAAVRPASNAECALSRVDIGGDASHPAASRGLSAVRSDLKHRALHDLLITAVDQPHTFTFDHIYSGERHTIVLDLGSDALLTDLIIYPCAQLSSLAVHVWASGSSEQQAKRIAVCTDIAQRSLVLNDLCPELHCRYIKIVVIGALGGSYANGRLTIGGLFGNVNVEALLSAEGTVSGSGGGMTSTDAVLSAYDDLECRYGSACAALLQQLEELAAAGSGGGGDETTPPSSQPAVADMLASYHRCCAFKWRMNRLRHAMLRLRRHRTVVSCAPPAASEPADVAASLATAPAVVLQALASHLVCCLLSLCAQGPQQNGDHGNSASPSSSSELLASLWGAFDMEQCRMVLEELCISSTSPPLLPVNAGVLLLHSCSHQPWWPTLLRDTVAKQFSATSQAPHSQRSLYLIICNYVNLSPSKVLSSVLESCVQLLHECLAPLASKETTSPGDTPSPPTISGSPFDADLVTWLLMFISHFTDSLFDDATSSSDPPRFNWDFLVPSGSGQTPTSAAQTRPRSKDRTRDMRIGLRRRFKSKLESETGDGTIDAAMADLLPALGDASSGGSPVRPGTPSSAAASAGSAASGTSVPPSGSLPEPVWNVDPKYCADVLRRLMLLINPADAGSSRLSSDTYMLACKVISRLSRCCSPPISVAALVDRSSLLHILQTCLRWGRPTADSLDRPVGNTGLAAGWSGPWAIHALSGLFLDMKMAERTWISQAYSQFYAADDSHSITSTISPRNRRSSLPESSRTPPSSGASLMEASRVTLDSVCNILNKLAVTPSSSSSTSSSVKLSSQIASLTQKSQHLRAKLDAMKSSQHHSMFSGKLKDVDAKIARLKNKVLEIQHKAAGLLVASSGQSTAGASAAINNRLRISSEQYARLEMSLSSTAETALRSLSYCQHVSNMSLWHCPPTGSQDAASSSASGDQKTSSLSPPSEATSTSESSGQSGKSVLDQALRQACSVQFLLCQAFDSLFQSMSDQTNIESLLELWLQLNPASGCGVTFVGAGTLNLAPETLQCILKVVCMRHSKFTLRGWTLLFHLLASVCYLSPSYRSSGKAKEAKGATSSASASPTAAPLDGWQALIGDVDTRQNLEDMLFSFFCQPCVNGSNNVGSLVIHIMETFLMHFVCVSGAIVRDSSPAGGGLDGEPPPPSTPKFKQEAYNLLLDVLLDLIDANMLGQGGAVDAQLAFVSFLFNNAQYVQSVDMVILKIWQSCCALCRRIGPTLSSSVFCSGGLAAKLEEKGKPVPPPQHRGYLSGVEPILCSVLWLVMELGDVPLWSSSPPSSASSASKDGDTKAADQVPAAATTGNTPEQDTDMPELSSSTDAEGHASPAGEQDASQSPDTERPLAGRSADRKNGLEDIAVDPPSMPTPAADDTRASATPVATVFSVLLLETQCISDLISCLNLFPWWHRPPGLLSLADLSTERVKGASNLLHRHRTKDVMDAAKMSDLLPSTLMSVLTALWSECFAGNAHSKPYQSFINGMVAYLDESFVCNASSGVQQSSPRSLSARHLAEPVAFLIDIILASPFAMNFVYNGGLNCLISNLVACGTSQWDFRPSVASHAMQTIGSLSTFTPAKRNLSREQESRNASMEKEDSVILKNYAPYGQISACPRVESSDSLEALLTPVAPYRRARAANWSYRFFSTSPAWISLTIQLPIPILLKVIQVTAHTLSLANAPSCVMVEAAKAPSGMLPVGCTLTSSGCGCTKVELLEPRIVTAVCIRLKRPADSDTLSLTHIGIYGTVSFSCSLSFAATGSHIGKTTSGLGALPLAHRGPLPMGWLHCINQSLQALDCKEDNGDADNVATPDKDVDLATLKLFPDSALMVRLLLCIFQDPKSSDCHELIEDILVKLIALSPLWSADLINVLLVCAAPVPAVPRTGSESTGDCTRLWAPSSACASLSDEAAAHLIYRICACRDRNFQSRYSILLKWLCCVASLEISTSGLEKSSSSLALRIQAAAASLYQMGEGAFTIDETYLTEASFRQLLSFNEKASAAGQLLTKAAQNALACFVRLRPVFFRIALDCSREISEKEMARSTANMLDCVCVMARSPECTELLLSSSFLDAVVGALDTIVHGSSLSPASCQTASKLLSCLSDLCRRCGIQGSLHGARLHFWEPLLQTLCASPSGRRSRPTVNARQLTTLQGAVSDFFLAVTHGDVANAEALAEVLCHVLQSEHCRVRPDIGFTRQLLSVLLVQSETVRVVLCPLSSSMRSSATLFRSDCQQQVGNHLSMPVGRGVLVREMSVCSSMLQLSETMLVSRSGTQSGGAAAAPAAATGAGMATPSTHASEHGATSSNFKHLLKKYNVDSMSLLEDVDPYEFETKWSSVLKSELSAAAEELAPAAAIASADFHFLASEPTLDVSCTLSDVLEHHPHVPRPSTDLQLFYSVCSSSSADKGREVDSHASLASKLRAMHRDEVPARAFVLLRAFALCQGLRILANHLPSWYGNVAHLVSSDTVADTINGVTVGLLPSYVPVLPPFDENLWPSSPARLPSHSLAALNLLLRLPGYGEFFVQNKPQAATLLRLLMGMPHEADLARSPSGKLCSIPALSLLPFAIFAKLLRAEPAAGERGQAVRAEALNGGVLHFLLAALSHLSHTENRQLSSGGGGDTSSADTSMSSAASGQADNSSSGIAAQAQAFPTLAQSQSELNPLVHSRAGPDGKLYWAKGTGFGTGSTHSTWDVNQAVTRQKKEESHVTALLEILAALFDCSGMEAESSVRKIFNHDWLMELLKSSCLVALLRSYVCNDSVLDMSCHLLVYSAVLAMVRSLSSCEPLSPLLAFSPTTPGNSIASLLFAMKSCLETYTLCLGKQKPSKTGIKAKSEKFAVPPSSAASMEANNEGIASLVLDVGETHTIVQTAIQRLRSTDGDEEHQEVGSTDEAGDAAVETGNDDYYVSEIKKLQFDSHLMVEENDEGVPRCTVDFHYKALLHEAVSSSAAAARAHRLAQEMATLATSLPVSSGSSVFVRVDEERLDVMKVLITGPEDSPYFGGCFEFDVFFPGDYPTRPMKVNLATTGNQTVRFNPNLYNDGKVCLSVLNTWHGRPEEKWNPSTSSLLQVLVSIQSLILVPEPYFNEPGYERSRNTSLGDQASLEYNANIKQNTIRFAMLEQLRKTPPAFKDVIERHFFLKQKEIVAEIEKWIADAARFAGRKRLHSYGANHVENAKRHLVKLQIELARLRDEPVQAPL